MDQKTWRWRDLHQCDGKAEHGRSRAIRCAHAWHAAHEGGIDGDYAVRRTLHNGSLKLMADQPRFRDVKIGIIVSSVRALKIFLRNAPTACNRLPTTSLSKDRWQGAPRIWRGLARIQSQGYRDRGDLDFLKKEELEYPGLARRRYFYRHGCGRVPAAGRRRRATRDPVYGHRRMRTAVSRPNRLFSTGRRKDVYRVDQLSPTGYPLRLLRSSPCINPNIKPQCEPFGYILNRDGTCAVYRCL